MGRKEDHSGKGLAGLVVVPMAELGDKGGCGRLVMMEAVGMQKMNALCVCCIDAHQAQGTLSRLSKWVLRM